MKYTLGTWEINWVTDNKCQIYSTPKQNHQEIRICRDVNEANARRIVQCVNSHDELVKLCRDLKARLSVYEGRHRETCILGDKCPDKRILKRAEQLLTNA